MSTASVHQISNPAADFDDAAPSRQVHSQQTASAASNSTLSITSMVLGIASVVAGWTLLVPIAGLVFGILGWQREQAGRGFAVAGIAINGALLLGVVAAMLFGLGVAVTAGAAGMFGWFPF